MKDHFFPTSVRLNLYERKLLDKLSVELTKRAHSSVTKTEVVRQSLDALAEKLGVTAYGKD